MIVNDASVVVIIRCDIANSSQYGETNVDILAPGPAILSTLSAAGYGHPDGTSQAAAYVTGVQR